MPFGSVGRAAWCVVVLSAVGLRTGFAAQIADDRPCRTDYAIQARYDEPERKITGTETITWVNESRDDVPDLWFHLYWNAFANDRSTHLSASGNVRGGGFKSDDWGWTRITSLVVGGQELVDKVEFVSPDDRRAEDHTVARVQLPKLASRGDVVIAQVKWEARMPRVRVRTGYKDDFLFVAQWFPKLGVYETGNGWNCHQFHASTEFFSDYGTYDVELDLPEIYENQIGASGVQTTPSRGAAGRVKVRFAAPSDADRTSVDRTGKKPLVHDFAWTADPQYVKYEATFHFDEWAARYPEEVDRVALALGRGRDEMRLRDVNVTVLLQPEHADQKQRHFDATCTALFFYGLWWGEYPYEHVTCVDPAWGAPAGGMEYPTLFTGGSSMFTKPSMHSPESVVVHECGHQFWYGLVGNNEFEAAWLDEGFNTFTQDEALWMRYGMSTRTTSFAGLPFDGVALGAQPGGGALADVLCGKRATLPWGLTIEPLKSSAFVDWWRDQPLFSFGRQRVDPRDGERTGYLSDPDTDPIDKAAWLYCDRNSYRTNSYRRTATALRSLQGLVGSDRFVRGMRSYAERWRYKHPYPQDFFDAFSQGAKVDVAWYFEVAFRSTATLDWSVNVSQSQVEEPLGWFPGPDGKYQKAAAKSTKASAPPASEKPRVAAQDAQPSEWKIDVLVKRKGDFILPLTVALTYADGMAETVTWSREEQARATWWRPLAARPNSRAKLVSAVIDPDRRYSFDANLADNEWHEAVDHAAPLRWSERVFEQYTSLLHWWGGLGG